VRQLRELRQPGPGDANSDGVGNACEFDDVDGDGVDNATDDCPDV